MSKKNDEEHQKTLAAVRDICLAGDVIQGVWVDLSWVDGLPVDELRRLQRDLMVTSRDLLSIAASLNHRIRIAHTEKVTALEQKHPELAKLDILRELGDV